MNVTKPDIKTLEDLINYSTLYDIRKYTMMRDVNGVIVSDETLLDVYFKMFKPYIQRVATLSAHQKYNYNPKLLSKDLYGTPDLDWVLVKINCDSPSRFKIEEKINYIHPEDIDTIFNILATKLPS